MLAVKILEGYLPEEEDEVLKKAMQEFVEKNEEQLKHFFQYKTGIFDRDLVHDALHDFYLCVMRRKILKYYNEDISSYSTYISTKLCDLLEYMQKRNFRYKHVAIPENLYYWYNIEGLSEKITRYRDKPKYDYTLVTRVKRDHQERHSNVDADIFEFVGRFDSDYMVDRGYDASISAEDENDPMTELYIRDFKKYILRTETKRRAQKMILFIDSKLDGCKSCEIAEMLGVSSVMVRHIREGLQKRYRMWQKESVRQ